MAFPERTGRQGALRVRCRHAMTQPEESSEIYNSQRIQEDASSSSEQKRCTTEVVGLADETPCNI